jgi:uncharacterized repeat protein (TIGR01451 family)
MPYGRAAQTRITNRTGGACARALRWLAFGAVWLAGIAGAVAPPPGTAIPNTAGATFQSGTGNASAAPPSNTVTAVVLALDAFKLTQAQNVTLAAGSAFALAHPLVSTGNVATTVTLGLAASGTLAPTGLAIVEDLNGNGVADPGEPVLGTSGQVTLAAGATLNLLVVGTVPAAATAGQSAQLRLLATDPANPGGASVVDTVSVGGAASIGVVKSASTAAPVQGGALAYTITALNSGGAAAAPVAVSVDGAPATLFVLRDVVPANTSFAASTSTTPGAQLLYHRPGDAQDSYVSAPPAPAPDAVAWALPELSAGATLVGRLGVTVDANAAGTLNNTAYAEFSSAGAATSVGSNAVQLALPALAPTVGFYTGPSYGMPLYESTRGAPLYLQFNAAQCNTNGAVVLTHPVTVVSQRTGDTETFTATETAANSGIFRVVPAIATADAAVRPPVSGDGVLEMLRDDVVTATVSGCGSAVATASIVVDPSSVVFDSKTNAPVAGATVQLLAVIGSGNGASNGSPATVYGPDGVTPAPSTATTASDGSFSFPLVPTGTYRLQVSAPTGYVFPSKVPANQLPTGRSIDPSGSYGGVFTISGGRRPVGVDVPLDAASAAGNALFLQKSANKIEAQVGDFIDYTVTVTNNSAAPLASATLVDALPPGLAYLRGSARWNGAPLPDPAGGAGPTLRFLLGNVATTTPATLSYRVRVDPGAIPGDNVNLAQANSGSLRSNQASASVKINGQVLADNDKAYVFGKVYADCNRNRIQDADEPGVPGVRIYLDNGTYAITDSEGKYSLYGLTPRTYVAKLDTTTLPDGAILELLDNRNAGDPGSQFVDLQFGEMHKTDFALAQCTPQLKETIAARRHQAEKLAPEILQAATAQVSLTAPAAGDARALPAAGIIGQAAMLPGAPGSGFPGKPAPAAVDGANAAPGAIPAMPVTAAEAAAPAAGAGASAAPPMLASLLQTLTPQAAFVDLLDEQLLPGDQIRVRVQGPYGTRLRLGVNEHDIGDSRVGEKSCLESRKVCAWEYVGVQLSPGRNVLRLAAVDAFGIVRGTSIIHVTAPGKLAHIEISGPAEPKADVPTPVSYEVRLTDEHGTPVIARTVVTLDATLGQWQARDIDPKEPGIQVAIEGGAARFDLLAPEHPGKAMLRIHSGDVHGEFALTFVPNLRPLIAAGLVEGALKLGSIHGQNLVPIQSGDAFESQIQGMSFAMDNGRDSADAHASLFLKGKISGADLLTLSYDSDKPGDTNLFRDIQPDKFYPVYGDSSVKGFDAQATSKLYVRIDHGTSYVLYGDYSTQSDNPARLLTQYSRALNGARTHVEDGRLTLDGFMSYTSSVQVVDEIPANGTSGPYELSRRNGIVNSQRVEIITRDRNQPSLVLSDVVLTQFTDYAIEPLLGQILFKAPVPSLDANLDPIYIRVTYELDSGGPSYWVAGLDAREKVAEGYTAGLVEIRDTNPANRATLRGVNLVCTRFTDTTVIAELAQSNTDLAGTGDARRIEVRHNDPRLQAKVYAVQTDPDFSNPNSTFNAGAAEYGAKVAYTLAPRDRLLVDTLRSTTSGTTVQDISSLPLNTLPATIPGGGMREGASVGIEHTLDKDLKITASLRHFDANDEPTQALAAGAVPASYDSARLRVDAPIPDVPRATAFAQYDAAIDGSGRDAATVGANYQLAPQTRIYATHETSDSLSGDYSLSPTQQNYLTVVGIDTTYMHDGQLFNEYRVGDAIDGRSAEAAVGLRNLWHLAPGLGLSTTVQRVHPISGTVNNEATALAGALEYTARKDWKGSTRLEWSDSQTAQTWLGSVGVAAKLDPSLTALARGLFSQQNGSAAAGSLRLASGQFGLALRPVDTDVWNALARIESKRNRNDTLGVGQNIDESADILSMHLNVQPSAPWTVDGRYGIKRAIDYLNAFPTYYTAQIAGARTVVDINDRWDAGLQYYIEKGASDGTARQQAYGFEVGYLLVKNSWLSIGYNVRGINDTDLAGGDYTQRAFYLRIRVKFDENLFKPRNNAQALPAEAMVP